MRRLIVATARLWCLLGLGACSNGGVQNAETNAPIGGATVTFRSVDGAAPSSFGTFLFGPTFSISTWNTGTAKGIYYLNPYAGDQATWTSRAVAGGWNRMAVEKTGFTRRIMYREHVYSGCEASTKNSISNTTEAFTPFSVGDPSNKLEAECAREDFKLFPSTSNHVLKPDLFVDPRTLADHLVQNSDGKRVLTHSIGVANGGDGVYEVAFDSNGIRQRIYKRLGSFDTLPTPAVSDWLMARIRPWHNFCSSPLTVHNCGVVREGNHSRPCTDATEYTFDPSYPTGAGQTVVMCPPVAVSGVAGISTGKASLLKRGTVGESRIDVTGLAPGLYWLEVEVNPVNTSGTRGVQETDFTNNITRTVIQL